MNIVTRSDAIDWAKSLGLSDVRIIDGNPGELKMTGSIPRTFWSVLTFRRWRLQRLWYSEAYDFMPLTIIFSGTVEWEHA